MKQIYLIHGWGGSDSSEGWFGWLKSEYSKDRINVISFNMPSTDTPKIEDWVGFLEKNIKILNKDTFFVGHSIGCQTILRYLEKLPTKVKIGGAVFVAGWFHLNELDAEEEKIARPWIETPINFQKIINHTSQFLAIFSDNDPYVPLSDSKIFEEKLKAKILIKDNEEHFNKTEQIKEIIEFINLK
jgi:uncharacterized protein